MILKPYPINTETMTYSRSENVIAAEASTIGFDVSRVGRVYDDACDTGLTLVSHRTGTEVAYVLTGVERDGEGDLLAWNFAPADCSGKPNLVIFND